MLEYNTKLKKLKLPEYGRNIQQMVDHCLTIDDKEQRTACAYSIVQTMETMFPPQGDQVEYRRKLWDHIAIMSDFKLDIDWPFEIIRPDSLNTQPDKVPLPVGEIEFKQYGNNIINMIDKAAGMEDSPEKDELVLLLANHMKKLLLAINPDGVEDERIFSDIRHITHGMINIDPAAVKLYDFKSLPTPKKKKKK